LTRILTLNKDIQIVGLSATIKNSKELAKWIGGKLVKSEWRPVDLRQGFFLQDSIHFQDGSHRTINMIPGHGTMFSLTLDMIKEGGQVLIFTNSRRSTMSLATKLAPKLRLSSSQEEKDDLDGLTNEFKAFYWDDLDSTKDLLKSLRGGIAFHHAGLKSDKLNFIVEKFNQGIIKVIVCTPTLAAGVNTPARRVIIKSLYRYESGKGMVTIPIIEYKQMAGRAGRPHFDPYGEVVIYNKKQDKVYDLAKQYIEGEPEEIISKIGKQNSLESHVLSLIVSKIARTKDEILKFLENSFYFYQLSNRPESEHSKICSFSEGFSEQVKGSKSKSVRNKKKTPKKPEINMGKGKDPLKLNAASDMFFQNAADLLKNKKKEEKMHKKRDMGHFMAREKIYHILESQLKEILTNFVLDGFLTVNATVSDIQKYQNTELGRITTQMYLPPSDALILYSGLEKALKIMEISSNPNKYQSRALAGKTIKTVTWLNLITQLSSFWKFYLKQHEFSVSQMFLDDNSEFLLVDEIPQPKQSNYRSFLEEIKLTMILNTWISEMDESEIIEKFGIGAGDLFRTVSTAKWLFRALLKLSKLQEFGDLHGKIEPLYLRIQHGVRPNLLELVRLKGIGRKRARMLYRGGLKTLNDIDNASIEKISNIPNFGMELAKSIKKQISQNHVGKTPLEENGQSNEETAHHKKEMHKKKGKGSDLTSINSIKKKAVSRDPSDGPKLLKNSSSLDSSKKDKVKGENSKDKPSRPKKTLDFFM